MSVFLFLGFFCKISFGARPSASRRWSPFGSYLRSANLEPCTLNWIYFAPGIAHSYPNVYDFFFPHRLVILQYRRIPSVSVSTFYFLMYRIIFLTRFIHRFCFVFFFLIRFLDSYRAAIYIRTFTYFCHLLFKTFLYLSKIRSNFLSFFLWIAVCLSAFSLCLSLKCSVGLFRIFTASWHCSVCLFHFFTAPLCGLLCPSFHSYIGTFLLSAFPLFPSFDCAVFQRFQS